MKDTNDTPMTPPKGFDINALFPGEVRYDRAGQLIMMKERDGFDGNVMDMELELGKVRGWGRLSTTVQPYEKAANIQDARGQVFAAAPDLYAALEEAREYVVDEIARLQREGCRESSIDLDRGFLAQVDAALARARGEAGVKDSFTTEEVEK